MIFSLNSRFYYFIFLDTGFFSNALNNATIFLCHINEILIGGMFWKIKYFSPANVYFPLIIISL
jgi:hypothetical protein